MTRLFALLLVLLPAAGCGPRVSHSPEWMTMGTVAKVSFKRASGFPFAASAADDDRSRRIADTARTVCSEVESRLSVWRKDSEISRYTSLDSVSPEIRPCYEAAFRLQKISGGVFNPFWRGKGKGPDLGGIAKGFAVDLAAKRLCEGGLPPPADGDGILLDFGGNLKVVSGEWRTGIRNPGGDMLTIVLTNGMACATSGEYERGKHIYDGRTGMPVSNDLVSVTVVHPASAMLADALSTTLFVLGREEGEAFLGKHFPEAKAYWIESH